MGYRMSARHLGMALAKTNTENSIHPGPESTCLLHRHGGEACLAQCCAQQTGVHIFGCGSAAYSVGTVYGGKDTYILLVFALLRWQRPASPRWRRPTRPLDDALVATPC
jgi:hypothetical protein